VDGWVDGGYLGRWGLYGWVDGRIDGWVGGCTMDGWMDSNESPFLGVPALRGLAWLVTKLASEAR
jgi:hypothetical protein